MDTTTTVANPPAAGQAEEKKLTLHDIATSATGSRNVTADQLDALVKECGELMIVYRRSLKNECFTSRPRAIAIPKDIGFAMAQALRDSRHAHEELIHVYTAGLANRILYIGG